MNTYFGSDYHKQNALIGTVKGNLKKKELAELRKIEYNKNPKLCECCFKPIEYKKKHTNKFCSHSCRATYNNKLRKPRTLESRLKTSEKLKSFKRTGQGWKIEYKNCYICNKLFVKRVSVAKKTCSDVCKKQLCSINGRKNAMNTIKRSKDEIKLYELCKAKFKNVENNKVIKDGWDADIVLADFKIAILWNGPWHYKQLKISNHSLLQVQTRDRIKKKLFEDNGWKVLIFEDRHYNPETAFDFITGYISSLS
jgi:hypothetical protein